MKGKLENYQLMNLDGAVGIISTNAPQALIEDLWKRLCQDELTDEESQYIEQEDGEDEAR